VEIKNKSKTDFCPCKVGVGAKERREKEGRKKKKKKYSDKGRIYFRSDSIYFRSVLNYKLRKKNNLQKALIGAH